MSDKDNSPDPSRREFVRVSLLVGLGACCAAAGVVPLVGQASAAAGAPVPIAPMEQVTGALGDFESLAKVGKPIAIEITLTRRDAGRNAMRAQTVFLQRVKEGAGVECFKALSPVCPHAGCTVELKESKFACPCHAATFDQKGARKEGPAPRDLDPLTLSVAPRDGKPWLHLQWQDFLTGLEERVSRA